MNPLQDIALNDMIDLVNSSHIPCGVFNYVHRPVALSSELEKIMPDNQQLLELLDADSIKKLPQAFGCIGNITLSTVPIKGNIYLIDVYYFGRTNNSYYLGTFRDIKSADSDKYFKAAALIQSNLQKTSEIIQEISMASNGSLELVSDSKISSDILAYIHRCSYRLMRYHTDSKLLNNIIFHIQPCDFESLDPVEIIKSVIKYTKEVNPDLKVKFSLNYEENDLSVFCDRKMMTRAIANVFSNILLLAQSKKPEIQIDVISVINGYTKITIECNKLKLTAKEIDMLMTGDFKSERKKATYDGLYITNSIILQHNGIFTVKSEKDTGTRIILGLYENIPKLQFRDSARPNDGDILHDIIVAELMM